MIQVGKEHKRATNVDWSSDYSIEFTIPKVRIICVSNKAWLYALSDNLMFFAKLAFSIHILE